MKFLDLFVHMKENIEMDTDKKISIIRTLCECILDVDKDDSMFNELSDKDLAFLEKYLNDIENFDLSGTDMQWVTQIVRISCTNYCKTMLQSARNPYPFYSSSYMNDYYNKLKNKYVSLKQTDRVKDEPAFFDGIKIVLNMSNWNVLNLKIIHYI